MPFKPRDADFEALVRASFRRQRMMQTLGADLLVFHSPVDGTVGIENAAHVFEAARHPKGFVSLDTADHLLTDARDAAYVGTVLAAWTRRYVSEDERATSHASAGGA